MLRKRTDEGSRLSMRFALILRSTWPSRMKFKWSDLGQLREYLLIGLKHGRVRAGVPNLVYMYPCGCICLSEGVHLWLEMEGKYIIIFLFANIYTCISEYNLYTCKNLKVLLKIQWISLFSSAFLSQEILGVHAHLLKCWRGTLLKKGWEPLC